MQLCKSDFKLQTLHIGMNKEITVLAQSVLKPVHSGGLLQEVRDYNQHAPTQEATFKKSPKASVVRHG